MFDFFIMFIEENSINEFIFATHSKEILMIKNLIIPI